MKLKHKLNAYYTASVLGVLLAVLGFSYNAWRLEVSENNTNIRTASFEVLIHLAELEHIIYAAHYDKDAVMGNPRNGWIKVGLIVDLSTLISPDVEEKSLELKATWSQSWNLIATEQNATNQLVEDIVLVRKEIKLVLNRLI